MSDKSGASRARDFATKHLPVILYVLVGLAWMAQGVRYLASDTLMPYHLAVIDMSWQTLDSNEQTLFLGLLKGFGAGSFGVGFAMVLLALIPLRAGMSWARWVIPAIAATYTGALVYVTSFALLAGAIPITVTTVLLGLIVVAGVCSFLSEN